MIHVSQIELNPRSRQVMSELRDPYQMHRTLSKVFGEDKESYEQARLLFRVEQSNKRGLIALVQSKMPPDWNRLTVSDTYWLSPPQSTSAQLAFHSGQGLAFRLRANPTVKREGKRLALKAEKELLEWLQRKGEQHGFAARIDQLNREAPFEKIRLREERQATLHSVQYDGILVVTDPSKLLEAVESGIGSGKAFGFGLLSLARVEQMTFRR